MPDFWQFPTVSMGLGPLMAIYQARFMRYLEDRGLAEDREPQGLGVLGDGEMDEPESLGAISLAGAREARQPDLRHQLQPAAPRRPGARQRQDHPGARGDFRGAGWNVIKVIWGSYWDRCSRATRTACCCKRMERVRRRRVPDFKANDGAYVREHFFGKYPELKEMVADMSDDDIWKLNRGGHDPHKVYAAYAAA
jgi:pyruvate dehydrogenase E1 component